MRKVFSLIGVFLLLHLAALPIWAEPEEDSGPKPPEIKASVALLVDRTSGRVLYEKDADAKRYPASTTKIMTALLAIEALDPAQIAVASQTAVDIDRDGSNMGILAGEELTVEQLIYGLLVQSANDAANVLAEEVSGSIPAFVEKMNARAAELGMNGTHFANPHGYHDDNHYTTARDLYLLADAAMAHDLFRKAVSTPTYEIPATNRYKTVRNFSNNNALINPMKGRKYLYSAATGIKTGHTSKAGNCLVASAEKDGSSFLCVVLDAPDENGTNYSFADPIALFQYGFTNFKTQTVSDMEEILATKEVKWAAGGTQAVLSAKEPLTALLPVGYDAAKLEKTLAVPDEIKAPVAEGETVGTITYVYDGTELGKIELISKTAVKKSYMRMIFGTLFHYLLSVWVMVPLGVLVAVILVLRWMELRRQKRRRRQRKYANRRSYYQ